MPITASQHYYVSLFPHHLMPPALQSGIIISIKNADLLPKTAISALHTIAHPFTISTGAAPFSDKPTSFPSQKIQTAAYQKKAHIST